MKNTFVINICPDAVIKKLFKAGVAKQTKNIEVQSAFTKDYKR